MFYDKYLFDIENLKRIFLLIRDINLFLDLS